MDESRCGARVVDVGGWHTHQCHRKIWQDGFCKIHHPKSVKKRNEESMNRYREKMDNSPLNLALKRIVELEKEIDELKAKLGRAEDGKE